MRFTPPNLPPLPARTRALALGAAAATTTAAIALLSSRARAKRDARVLEAFRAATLRRAAASAASARALARSLADPQRSSLLVFYAPDCRLCAEMVEPLVSISTKERKWLDVVPVDADDGASWAPEALRYQVENVPTFVMLDAKGMARGKSVGVPESVEAASKAVGRLVVAARPRKVREEQEKEEREEEEEQRRRKEEAEEEAKG